MVTQKSSKGYWLNIVYLGFNVAFNTVQVISRRVVGRAEETSTQSSLGLCTVNCRPTASKLVKQDCRLQKTDGTQNLLIPLLLARGPIQSTGGVMTAGLSVTEKSAVPTLGRQLHIHMVRQIVLGFLIWKMLNDLQMTFFIREPVLNVLVASTMDAICPEVHHGKIKLLYFSINASWTLSVIDICKSSVSHPWLVPNVLKPIWNVLVASLTSLTPPHQ